MKTILKILIVPVYLIFAQIHPLLHWHNHDAHNNVDLDICLQYSEHQENDCGNENYHKHTNVHDHGDAHCTGDWIHISKVKGKSISPGKQFYILHETDYNNNESINPLYLYIPLNPERYYLQDNFSDRAPPRFC